MSENQKSCCAHMSVRYTPLPVELENPVTGKMIKGEQAHWSCTDCGEEFRASRWGDAVIKQQQDEIERLRADLHRKNIEIKNLKAAQNGTVWNGKKFK